MFHQFPAILPGVWASEKVNDQVSNPDKPTLMRFDEGGKGDINGLYPLAYWRFESPNLLSWQVEDAPISMDFELLAYEEAAGRMILKHRGHGKETILVKRD